MKNIICIILAVIGLFYCVFADEINTFFKNTPTITDTSPVSQKITYPRCYSTSIQFEFTYLVFKSGKKLYLTAYNKEENHFFSIIDSQFLLEFQTREGNEDEISCPKLSDNVSIGNDTQRKMKSAGIYNDFLKAIGFKK